MVKVMKLSELLNEKYDKDHTCLTPGTIYHIDIHSDKVEIVLNLPDDVNEITEVSSDNLESEIHYALEKIISNYFF